jgi:hypothetical protein
LSTSTETEHTNEEEPTAVHPVLDPLPEQGKGKKDKREQAKGDTDEPEVDPLCMPPGCGN